jgi:glycerol-3-phosphate dehydrogenase
MSTDFSFQTRALNLERLKTEEFDLAIIGGGINGAGVARDAASRGMRVALIEAQDFASGTSSRSSKLIHGGIRYLENREFGLVFEALSERRRLFELAPHLVHPLRFVLPMYEGSRVGMNIMSLGMWLYDALSLFETPEPHERLRSSDVLERIPSLKAKGLLGAFAYSDAYMDDDRLVLETLRAAHREGACLVSYAEATGASLPGGKVHALEVTDAINASRFQIRAKHFISTVGPWTDFLAPRLVGLWRKRMRPSKGIHLTFSKEKFPLEDVVVMGFEKRIVFAIPRKDMVIVGTTDTDYSGDPGLVRSDQQDVAYVLQVLHQYFPGTQLVEKDVIASYSGVRPLVHDDATTESQTSREHEIINDERNVTFVMGGKYTTYRRIAEQTVKSALTSFTVEDQVQFHRNQTVQPLNPFVTKEEYQKREPWIDSLQRHFAITGLMAESLFDRHGPEAKEILARYLMLVMAGPGALQSDEEKIWSLEAHHAIDQTMCLNLADFFLRRTPLVLSRPDHGERFWPCVAKVFRERLGLSEADIEAQFKNLTEKMNSEFSWRASSLK